MASATAGAECLTHPQGPDGDINAWPLWLYLMVGRAGTGESILWIESFCLFGLTWATCSVSLTRVE